LEAVAPYFFVPLCVQSLRILGIVAPVQHELLFLY
jgi:hypothetical protein